MEQTLDGTMIVRGKPNKPQPVYDGGKQTAMMCYNILTANIMPGSADATKLKFGYSENDWQFAMKLLTDLNWIQVDGDQICMARNEDLEVFILGATEYSAVFLRYFDLQLKRLYNWTEWRTTPLDRKCHQEFFMRS